MNSRNRPPQAYPRETLNKAYEWLSKQRPATKELANDMETLVSLYLQDQKLKERRKKKSEDSLLFKEELKSLAQGVKAFNSTAPEQEPSSIQTPSSPISTTEIANESDQTGTDEGAAYSTPPSTPLPSSPITQQTVPVRPTQQARTTGFIDPQKYLSDHQSKINSQPTYLPDPNIKNMLQTTQNKLNLSSEEEAMKALISIGFEQFKKLFS